MRRTQALQAAVGLAAIVVLCGRFYQAHAQGQAGEPPPRFTADPTYVQWPRAASGKAYASIDGKRLWQYVKEQTDIAERYRDQGHPQFWGRIAGTSGDVEAAQWLLKKYQQLGLIDARIQDVYFFHPQWAPQSWTVSAASGITTIDLPSAQPPYGATATDGKVLDLPVGQKSFLVWGTLPGATDETIYVILHRDGWFDAAGDNASGVATLLGMAEYFAKVPQRQRRRTMVFVGTDGHHQQDPGGYGRWWMAANRDKLFAKTALMFNAEHPAQVLTHGGAESGWTETIIPPAWYAGGSGRPQLTKIAFDAFHEFGLPVWAQPGATPPGGDLLPFFGFLPGVVVQSNDFMYMHTTADTAGNVAWTGLEAGTRAYAKIVDEVNKLPLSALPRAPEGPFRSRLDLTDCAA